MKIRKSKGFTLIELMITVAIIGILAAIALPAYQDYTIRAQMTESVILLSGQKAKVEEWYALKGALPSDSFEADVGCHSACGTYVDYIEVLPGTPGKLFGRMGPNSNIKIRSYSIFLTATISPNGNLQWECTSNTQQKWLPSTCKSTWAI